MKTLNKRQILMLHSALVSESGGSNEIRDEGLLDSAIKTPFQTCIIIYIPPMLLKYR